MRQPLGAILSEGSAGGTEGTRKSQCTAAERRLVCAARRARPGHLSRPPGAWSGDCRRGRRRNKEWGQQPGDTGSVGLGLVAAHVAAVEVRMPLDNGGEPRSVLGGGTSRLGSGLGSELGVGLVGSGSGSGLELGLGHRFVYGWCSGCAWHACVDSAIACWRSRVWEHGLRLKARLNCYDHSGWVLTWPRSRELCSLFSFGEFSLGTQY